MIRIRVPRAPFLSTKARFVLINRESWIRPLSLIRDTWSIIRHVARRNRRSIRQLVMRDHASPPGALRIRPVGNIAVK